MIELHIENITTHIEGYQNYPDFSSLYIVLRQRMSFRPEGYYFTPMYRSKRWDGWKRLIWKNQKQCYFPTGLFSIVKDFFQEQNIPIQIIDHRIKPTPTIFFTMSEKKKLRDYQQRIVTAAVEKSRGIIQSPTGSGKSITAAGIINACSASPFLILVTSIDLLEQMKDHLEESLLENGKNIRVGRIGGGEFDIREITVMTVQTAVRALGKKFVKFDSDQQSAKDGSVLKKYRKEIVDLIHGAKGVIGDETQHWKSDMCQIVTNNMFSAFYRWGASATPYRDQGDDLLIQSCFGKKICEIKASELIEKGYLVQPHITFVHVNPPPTKYKNWQNIYKEQVVENEYYNSLIANIAEEYVKRDRTILILVQQIEHGKTLESMIEGSLFVHGESSKKERLSALQRLRNKYINCLISTSLFDEGIDCCPLNTLLLAGGGKSPTRAMQRIGRVMRLYEGKESATVIDFYIHEKYLEDHAKAREKMYKTEPKYVVRHKFID